jgi:hypothetical protein
MMGKLVYWDIFTTGKEVTGKIFPTYKKTSKARVSQRRAKDSLPAQI